MTNSANSEIEEANFLAIYNEFYCKIVVGEYYKKREYSNYLNKFLKDDLEHPDLLERLLTFHFLKCHLELYIANSKATQPTVPIDEITLREAIVGNGFEFGFMELAKREAKDLLVKVIPDFIENKEIHPLPKTIWDKFLHWTKLENLFYNVKSGAIAGVISGVLVFFITKLIERLFF